MSIFYNGYLENFQSAIFISGPYKFNECEVIWTAGQKKIILK